MTWLGSLMRAVASAFYWWGVGWLIYMVVAGDRFPLDREPGLWEVYGPVTLAVIGAIVVNALLVHLDRRRSSPKDVPRRRDRK